MTKKILSILAVVLLASMLTVFAFAADGGYSSLALAENYANLEEGDTVTVYIVVSPTIKSTHGIYRPYGSGKAGLGLTTANADLFSQKYTVEWDSAALELTAAPEVLTGQSDNTGDFTDKDGNALYWVSMMKGAFSNANVMAPSISATWTDSVSIEYSNGGSKFIGLAVKNGASDLMGCVAKLTFKVKNVSSDTTTAIKLTDTYAVVSATNVVTRTSTDDASKAVSVSIKAGCQHANKSNEVTVPSTCYSQGTYTYHCDDCGSDVEEKLPFEPHNYKNAEGQDNRLNLVDPTCTEPGISYLYCSNEGCTHYDSTTEAEVDPAGHSWTKVVVSTLSCVSNREEFYYCPVCYRLAADGSSTPASDADVVTTCYYDYENDKFYRNHGASGFNSEVEAPSGNWYYVVVSEGHDLYLDDNGNYRCANEDICDVEGDFTVRYVGNTAKGSGDTSAECTDLASAMKHFSLSGLPEDVECYIYLVEDITLTPSVYDSEYNKMADSFEEYPHDVHVTITSADVNDKAVITMPKTCPRYYLYGPTTFEYVNFASDEKNTIASLNEIDGSPQGTTDYNRYIAARGFKLVLGEGLEMLNKGNGLKTAKTNSGVAGLKAESVITSDMKLYAIAGVEGSSEAVGAREGFNPTNFTTEMEVLSGSYWSVYAFNRNGAASYDNCVAKITFGNIAVDTITTNTEAVPMNNCHVYYMYTGKVTVRLDLRFAFAGATTGSGNVINRFFFPGFTGSIIGDSMLNSTKQVGFTLNLYYYDNGTDSLKNDPVVNGLIVKQSKLTDYPLAILGDVKSIAEWCINNGSELFGENGHYYEDGECSFCGVSKCRNHVNTEWVVSEEANCMNPGSKYEYCLTCFEVIQTVDTPSDSNLHNVEWVFNDGVPTASCTLCGTTLADASTQDLSKIYLSVNGFAAGGFTPRAPINDLETALKLAALADGPATIYVMDKAVVVSNVASTKGYYAFLEPEHSNEITICGYNGNLGMVEFGGGIGTAARMTYNLSGPTKFESVEFTSGISTSNLYVIARHNPLTFGERVTVDAQRVSSGTTGQVVVVGGCYDETFNCHAGNTSLTFYSGTFYQIIGGNIRTDCTVPTVNINVLGNVSASEQVVFGNYQVDSQNIVVVLDGVLTSNKDITFACDQKSSGGVPYKANNVTLILRSGTMLSEATFSSTVGRPLGAAETNEQPTTRINGKLTVWYDPSVSTTQMLCNKIAASSDRSIFVAKILTEDNNCLVTNGAHTPEGAATATLAATCFSEGYNEFVCSACGNTYREVLSVVDHDYVSVGTLAANCVSPELEKFVCQNDGCAAVKYDVVGDAIDADSHNVVDGVCVNCLKTLVQLCAARDEGHSFGDWYAVDANCGSGEKRVCDNCGYVEVNITDANHNYGPFSISVDPTETAPGVKVRTCKSCGKVDTAILYSSESLYTDPVATDAEGNALDLDIALSKLSKYERAAINTLLQDTEYGSEVKVSYSVEGGTVTGVTYSIPVPSDFNDLTNVKIVVKDDNGEFHVVDFKVEMGYIVFTF